MSEGCLTHLNERGEARMVDVSAKEATARTAVARGRVRMAPATLRLIDDGKMAKGDVFTVARVAGIMAAKRTSELIPMCHPLALTGVEVRLWADHEGGAVQIEATVKTNGPTGVEMEALCAVSAAALTVYDMCKSAQRDMVIEEICLVRKTGGARGDYQKR